MHLFASIFFLSLMKTMSAGQYPYKITLLKDPNDSTIHEPNNSYINPEAGLDPNVRGPESTVDVLYKDPIKVIEFEPYLRLLPPATYMFVSRGSFNDELTVIENHEAYRDYRLVPRYLTGRIENTTMNTTILGNRVNYPFGFSPSAFHKLYHSDGEIGTAKACAKLGIFMGHSAESQTLIEDIGKAAGGSPCILMQNIYLWRNQSLNYEMINRAHKAGFKGIIISIDIPYYGIRDFRQRYGFTAPSAVNIEGRTMSSGQEDEESDPRATWETVAELVKKSPLPIIPKGVLTVEDARNAQKAGCKAIIVSNHGGRQLDNVQPTLRALPSIVQAVGKDMEVYVDGGVRDGISVLKALALGARAVLIGRPVTWGLAYGGGDGVHKVGHMILRELERAMKLSGHPTLNDIYNDPNMLTSARSSQTSQGKDCKMPGFP